MTDLPHLAARIFGTPLLVERGRLDVMLGALGPRLGLAAPQPAMDGGVGEDDEGERCYRITPEGVAIIPVVGTLVARSGQMTVGCTELRSYASIKADIAEALDSPQVRGVVIDEDSCGGEVSLCLETAAWIASQRGRKPIIAMANAAAYSAAYALASAADRIIIPDSGGVGSIGVVAVHVDQSAADKMAGLRWTYIAAGARKLDGNPHAPLTDAAAGVIGAEVERLYGLFVDLVARNRGISAEKVRATEAGLFFGSNAVAARLADQIGTIDDAIRLAAGGFTSTARGRPVAQPARGTPMAETSQAGGDAQASTTPTLTASGSDTNVSLNIGPRGSGSVQLGSMLNASASVSATNPATAAAAGTGTVDMAAIRAAAERDAAAAFAARAKAISALCDLAGVPNRATAFITAGATEAEVRDTLLAERAAASGAGGEISGSRSAAPPAGAAAGNAVAAAASWDRVGRNVFGAAWKGI